jgi:phage regulator Rha-like protein
MRELATIPLVFVKTGKSYTNTYIIGKNIFRDNDKLVKQISSNISSFEAFGDVRMVIDFEIINNLGAVHKMDVYELNQEQASLLMMLVRAEGKGKEKIISFRVELLKEFCRMRDELERLHLDARDRRLSAEKQREAMMALQMALPEEERKEPTPYYKANTVVNKATSTYFGFDKMIKKGDMPENMIPTRDQVLDDYIQLFEVIQDNSTVAQLLYNKSKPKQLEVLQ